MRARIAASLLVPILVTLVPACDSADPLDAVALDRVDVRIDGPTRITENGRYSWMAVTDGGGHDFDFEWEVLWWTGPAEQALRVAGPVLTLDVDVRRGDLAIRLYAYGDGARHIAEQLVSACSATDADDRLIEECLIQH